MNYIEGNSIIKSYFMGSRSLNNVFWALTVSFGGMIKPDPNHKKNHYVNSTGARVEVCSRHEEVLGSIPAGAEVLAKDDDGNTEAWKLKNIGCVLWHPERMNNHWMPNPLNWHK